MPPPCARVVCRGGRRSGRSCGRRCPTGRMPAAHSCQNSWPSRSVSTGPPGPRSAGWQAHGGADRDELDRAGRPVVGALLDAHADDRVGADGLRLLEQPPEREPAALVVGVGDASRTRSAGCSRRSASRRGRSRSPSRA